MWGYESTTWMQTSKRGGVDVYTVADPAGAIEIPNGEATLWRYIDFAKLLSLLTNQSLYFASFDQLGDPFEGQWSNRTLQMISNRDLLWTLDEPDNLVIEDKTQGQKLLLPKAEAEWSAEDAIKHWYPIVRHPRELLRQTFVNCWYQEDDESEAMWKLFAGEEYGVAVKTTAAKLIGSFTEHLPDYLGYVKYVPYDKYAIPVSKLPPVFYKRTAFRHEREVRVVAAPMLREESPE